MKDTLIEIFDQMIIGEYGKSLHSKFCFACSYNYFEHERENKPFLQNCYGRRNIVRLCSHWGYGSKMKSHLRDCDEDFILDYMNALIKGRVKGHKLSDVVEDLLVRQFKAKLGFSFDKRKKNPLHKKSESLKDFKIEFNVQGIKSDDFPHFNKKDRGNAKKFASLYHLFYHLEVSIRNYLKNRFVAVYKNDWQKKIIDSGLFIHAVTRKNEVDNTEYFTKRGDNILNYCNWNDYPQLIDLNDNIWDRKTDKNEFMAHISTMYKIRNAIAHNAETIPPEMIKEMEVFLEKYIKIMSG